MALSALYRKPRFAVEYSRSVTMNFGFGFEGVEAPI